jgi:hypothetical protein
MNYRDSLVATAVLGLGTLAMAAVIGSGAYVQAAGAEARGVHALSAALAQALRPAAVPAPAPATLLAAASEALQ